MEQTQIEKPFGAGLAGLPGGAAARVYEDLRARIISFDLPPDAQLSRAELAAEYEVSQTPIREALQRLEQDGLVRIYPQSRTVVSKIDIGQLYEAHFLRVAVECEVVRRLAESGDPGGLDKARAILAMQETLAGKLDQIALFNELDEAFHLALLTAAGQGNLYYLLRAKAGHLARARRLDLPRAGKMLDILARHREIVEAIASGSGNAAAEAMRAHLGGTVANIETLRDENPAFFRS